MIKSLNSSIKWYNKPFLKKISKFVLRVENCTETFLIPTKDPEEAGVVVYAYYNLTLGRLELQDHKFKVSLHYTGKLLSQISKQGQWDGSVSRTTWVQYLGSTWLNRNVFHRLSSNLNTGTVVLWYAHTCTHKRSYIHGHTQYK